MHQLTLRADISPFARKLQWIASKLESRDTRESLGDLILDRLIQAVSGVGGEKIYEFGGMTTASAGVLGVRVEAAGVLEELATALRALGFEFHG